MKNIQDQALLMLAYRKRTNHILHLILTLITGIWVVPWFFVALSNSIHNRQLERKILASGQ